MVKLLRRLTEYLALVILIGGMIIIVLMASKFFNSQSTDQQQIEKVDSLPRQQSSHDLVRPMLSDLRQPANKAR